MIPICLVTGFLGSGKTTLLRRIVEARHGERIVYLVNDFAQVDIDTALLAQAEDDVVAIPGGSIFCQCLVTQFVYHLRHIPERFHTADEPIVGVVIEASGIANPMVVEQMLSETRLDATYAVASIISIVDPGSLPMLVHTLPNIAAQIRAADTVLLNKIDLFDAAQVAQAERIVREINPGAQVVRTVRCGVDLDLFSGAHPRGLHGEYAACADPHYASYAIALTEPTDPEELGAELEALRDEIYRAKGFVPTSSGMVYLDLSASGLSMEPAATEAGWAGLVIIARGERHAGVSEFARRHGATEA
ncbi:MAG: GTP-binding protein [Armatimonadota bacterium]